MGRVAAPIGVLCAITLACGSPTTPSDNQATLVVRIVDETTNQLITSSDFGIGVRITGPVTRSQSASAGLSSFADVPPGIYSLTSEILYGYFQLDVISIGVSDDRTYSLKLKPIDDLAVTEVFVDGQGSVPKGGTIDVPPSGVTFRVRGKYQSLQFPLTELWFSADTIAPDGRAFGAGLVETSRAVDATSWERVTTGWRPCSGASNCQTASESFNASMFTPGQFGRSLMIKTQPWRLNFRMVPN